MKEISAGQFKTHCLAVMEKVRVTREPVLITKRGRLVAKLAEQPEVSVARARFGNKVLRWSMAGSLGVEGEPFTLAMKLYVREGLLVGDAETSPLPTNPDGFQTYYWVQLKSDK